MKDYAIIYNPTSANGKSKKQFQQVISNLDRLNVSYKLFESKYYGHAIELASQLATDGYCVIGAGGDGTCNEVFHGVITSGAGALCGFIPIGSGNDIPAALGIPPNVKRACEIIAEGRSSKSDIGLATPTNGDPRYFIGIGSQGFDALVTKRTNEGKKWLPGTWNYISSVLKTIFTWKSKEIIMKTDSETIESKANLIAVGNGPSYGGGMYMCQCAVVDDGKFHVTLVNMPTFEVLRKFKSMYSADLMPDPKASEYCTKKIRIEMKNPEDDPYIVQVDGEIIGTLPVDYETIPNGYEFIRPEQDEVLEAFKKKYGRCFNEYSH